MRLLKSRKNKRQLGKQMVAAFFAIALAGSPIYQNLAIADISPGCQKEYEELGKQCVTAMATNDVSGQTGVAGATSSGGCPAGQSRGYPAHGYNESGPVCQPALNLAAGQAQNSALIAKEKNANVSASLRYHPQAMRTDLYAGNTET
jgi:hypothetical protein